MTTKTEHLHLDIELTLYPHSPSSLPVHTLALYLTKQDDEIIECRLTFCINPELYHRIDTEALFNLKPEIRTPLTNGEFQPLPDIQIEFFTQFVRSKCQKLSVEFWESLSLEPIMA